MSLALVDKTWLLGPEGPPGRVPPSDREEVEGQGSVLSMPAGWSHPAGSGTCSQPALHVLHPSESLGLYRAKPLPTDMTAITAPLNSCQQHAGASHTIRDGHHPFHRGGN